MLVAAIGGGLVILRAAGLLAVLNLAEGVCGHWGLGRKNPIDLSEDIPVEKFQDIMDHLFITGGDLVCTDCQAEGDMFAHGGDPEDPLFG